MGWVARWIGVFKTASGDDSHYRLIHSMAGYI